MNRCAGCDGIALGSIDVEITVRPIWDRTIETTERHTIGLCEACIARLADGREVSAELLQEVSP